MYAICFNFLYMIFVIPMTIFTLKRIQVKVDPEPNIKNMIPHVHIYDISQNVSITLVTSIYTRIYILYIILYSFWRVGIIMSKKISYAF